MVTVVSGLHSEGATMMARALLTGGGFVRSGGPNDLVWLPGGEDYRIVMMYRVWRELHQRVYGIMCQRNDVRIKKVSLQELTENPVTVLGSINKELGVHVNVLRAADMISDTSQS